MASVTSEKFLNILPATSTEFSYIVKSVWTSDTVEFEICDLSKDDNNEFKGKISVDEFRTASSELDIPYEEFLNECKQATITNNGLSTFQYSIENNTFIWRKIGQFKIMYLSVNLAPCSNLKTQLLLECIDTIHTMKTDIESLKTDIDLRDKEHQQFVERYEKYVDAKNNIEEVLLTKAAALLNTKKDKIAQLQNLLYEKKIQTENIDKDKSIEYNTTDEEGDVNEGSTFSKATQVLPKRKKVPDLVERRKNKPLLCPSNPESSDSTSEDENIFALM